MLADQNCASGLGFRLRMVKRAAILPPNCRVDRCGLPTESPFFFVRSRNQRIPPRAHLASWRGSCAQPNRKNLADSSKQTANSKSRAVLGAVEEIVRPVLSAHGLELFDLSYRAEQGGWVLRVVIDSATASEPQHGVSVDQCADASRDLSSALDVADPLPNAYTLEVSSPGVERPLRGLDDYVRFTGNMAKITLLEPIADFGSVIRGKLAGVDEDRVLVDVDPPQLLPIPLSGIKRAHLVYELPGQPKKGQSKKKRRSAKGRH